MFKCCKMYTIYDASFRLRIKKGFEYLKIALNFIIQFCTLLLLEKNWLHVHIYFNTRCDINNIEVGDSGHALF